MILALFYAVVILLCVSGICDFIIFLRVFLVSPKKSFPCRLFVLLQPDIYREQLNSLLQKKNWYGDSYCSEIVASTKLLTKMQSDDCKKLYKNSVTFIDDTADYPL